MEGNTGFRLVRWAVLAAVAVIMLQVQPVEVTPVSIRGLSRAIRERFSMGGRRAAYAAQIAVLCGQLVNIKFTLGGDDGDSTLLGNLRELEMWVDRIEVAASVGIKGWKSSFNSWGEDAGSSNMGNAEKRRRKLMEALSAGELTALVKSIEQHMPPTEVERTLRSKCPNRFANVLKSVRRIKETAEAIQASFSEKNASKAYSKLTAFLMYTNAFYYRLERITPDCFKPGFASVESEGSTADGVDEVDDELEEVEGLALSSKSQ